MFPRTSVQIGLAVHVTSRKKTAYINIREPRLHPLLLPNKENRGNPNPYIYIACIRIVRHLRLHMNKADEEGIYNKPWRWTCGSNSFWPKSHINCCSRSKSLTLTAHFLPSAPDSASSPPLWCYGQFFSIPISISKQDIRVSLPSASPRNFRSHNKTPITASVRQKPRCRCTVPTLIMLFAVSSKFQSGLLPFQFLDILLHSTSSVSCMDWHPVVVKVRRSIIAN